MTGEHVRFFKGLWLREAHWLRLHDHHSCALWRQCRCDLRHFLLWRRRQHRTCGWLAGKLLVLAEAEVWFEGWQSYSAGNTASTPFFFTMTTRNLAGFVALALRPTVCTSSGPS